MKKTLLISFSLVFSSTVFPDDNTVVNLTADDYRKRLEQHREKLFLQNAEQSPPDSFLVPADKLPPSLPPPKWVPHPATPPYPSPFPRLPEGLSSTDLLILSARDGHIGTVKNLLTDDLDANIKVAALIQASSRGHAEIVKMFIDAGADVNAIPQIEVKFDTPLFKIPEEDRGPMTALMTAAHGKHVEVVKTLLVAGANPRATDRSGRTIRDYVMEETPDERATKLFIKMLLRKEIASEEIEQTLEKGKIYEQEMEIKRNEIIALLETALEPPKETEP